MSRNIVLCLDGTSNQYSATNTNVVNASVFERMKLVPTYRPPNIPADHQSMP